MKLEKLIHDWYRTPLTWRCWVLRPFSKIFSAIVKIRCWFYQKKIVQETALPVPVIVVGNITVGGTGKTPFVIWLAQFLKSQGFKPGIISRGYKGTIKVPFYVTADSNPVEVGDEPVLIAMRTKCPVVVARRRVDAARVLLQQGDFNVIISDDGLQHYALKRDIEIAVVDGERRYGNALLLPAGPLREPISRLRNVQFIISNGVAREGEYAMQLTLTAIYNIQQPSLVLDAKTLNQPIHAVAGIGHPQRFFNQLRTLGLQVIEHPFSDHHEFTAEDIHFADDKIVIMTEKDAVKCRAFCDSRHWCFSITSVLPVAFEQAMLKQLSATNCHEKER